jgi:hypothetical protein
MHRKISTFTVTALCAFVTACSPVEVKSDRNDNPVAIDPAVGTRIALLMPDDAMCPAPSTRGIGALFFSLARAVAPKLIERGVSWLPKYFSNKAQQYNANMSSQTAGLFFTVKKGEDGPVFSSGYGCVAVAHGVLQTGDAFTEPPAGYPESLGLASKPDVYLQSWMNVHVEGGTPYLRLVPMRLEFNEPLAARGKIKDLVVTYSFTFLSGSGEKTVSFVVPTLENLQPGTIMTETALGSLSTEWSGIPLPEITDEQLDQVLAGTGESSAGMLPMSLVITLTETDQGRGAAIYNGIAEALEQSKSAISGVLTKTLEESLPE